MRISDWSSDVCSSDLAIALYLVRRGHQRAQRRGHLAGRRAPAGEVHRELVSVAPLEEGAGGDCVDLSLDADAGQHLGDRLRHLRVVDVAVVGRAEGKAEAVGRSEEHTSELQSLMRISYAVFCLK